MNLDSLSDILFPPTCMGCSRKLPAGVICTHCQNSIELYKTLFCGTCSARLPALKKICHPATPYILGAATRYDDRLVQKLIHTLKFHGVRTAALPLATILIQYVGDLGLDLQNFIVVPVPLSMQRRRGRGFNQSALIAKPFAEYFLLPLEETAMTRVVHKKPQSETNDILERKENLRGCFFVAHPASVSGKNIVLIDDVTTSGTTFMETARVLKVAGAKKIIALAVARA